MTETNMPREVNLREPFKTVAEEALRRIGQVGQQLVEMAGGPQEQPVVNQEVVDRAAGQLLDEDPAYMAQMGQTYEELVGVSEIGVSGKKHIGLELSLVRL